ncbi:hypothetical protein B7Z17_02535, partial [Candidatus Saccharibacteria bacterium 32-49-10]
TSNMAKQKQTQSKNRPRTYARNRAAVSRRGYEKVVETDGAYFLKLVICVLLGTFWIKFAIPLSWNGFIFNALPIGLFVGLLLVHKYEGIQFDRKIWYAVLIVVTIISYFLPAGIII